LIRLPAVIGINSQHRKREERACALESSQHRLPAAMEERQAFCPPSGYVRERQCVQVATFDIGTTVGHKVRLQKARAGLLPLREGSDLDLLLEQGAGSRCGEAALASFALGTQETIGCGCAHGKQLAAALRSRGLSPRHFFLGRGSATPRTPAKGFVPSPPDSVPSAHPKSVGERDAGIGRPSIDPVVFFKLQLIMFFENIRSERLLMRLVADRLSVRWYLGYDLNEPLPDHSSLSKIRQRYGLDVFRHFFEAIVQRCQEANLVDIVHR